MEGVGIPPSSGTSPVCSFFKRFFDLETNGFELVTIRKMDQDLMLRRKWTFRTHGRQIVLVKKRNEQSRHVLMKAFLWSLYLPSFPLLTVEVGIGEHFKPDVVSLSPAGTPEFWGEAGHTEIRKIRFLLRRYRSTHIAVAKWNSRLKPFEDIIRKAVADLDRDQPIDLLNFPPDSSDRFMDKGGNIHLTHDDLEWVRIWRPRSP